MGGEGRGGEGRGREGRDGRGEEDEERKGILLALMLVTVHGMTGR